MSLPPPPPRLPIGRDVCGDPTCRICYPLGLSNTSLAPPSPDHALEQVLVATPIEGWRAWDITRVEELTLDRDALAQAAEALEAGGNPFRVLAGKLGPRLRALALPLVWDEPVMRARCLRDALPGRTFTTPGLRHAAPHASCQCGFWVVRDQDLIPGDPRAYGRVATWGRVIEFQRGWRGEYARPLEIILPGGDEETAEALRSFYGCEVRIEVCKPPEPVDYAAQRRGLQLLAQQRRQIASMSMLLPPPPSPSPRPHRRFAPFALGLLAGGVFNAVVAIWVWSWINAVTALVCFAGAFLLYRVRTP
jgi:hypothetical protein